MFDGMGGPNGLLPADLMHLTDDQTESLFARPLAEMSRRIDREGGDGEVGGGGEVDSPDALRREWQEFTGPKPPEFWEAEFRKIVAERTGGG